MSCSGREDELDRPPEGATVIPARPLAGPLPCQQRRQPDCRSHYRELREVPATDQAIRGDGSWQRAPAATQMPGAAPAAQSTRAGGDLGD
jgi:hypothetical protein